MYRVVWILFSSLFCFFVGADEAAEGKSDNQLCIATEKPIEILYFQPDGIRNTFWSATQSFANAVADDLDIKLSTVGINSTDHNRIAFEELVDETLTNNKRADFIMSVLFGGGEIAQLERFESFGIPFFTVNTSLDEKVLKMTGRPREKFKNWLGHMSPNEIKAGKQLVSDLHRANVSSNNIMGILGGSPLSIISIHRVSGALQTARDKKITVIPPINTDWTEVSSEKAARTLLHRVSQFDMLWTAGPDIAKGAIQVLQESDKRPVVGSFDWSTGNAELIKQGLMEVSYGGHFMQPGWAVILINDYLKGMDFYHELGGLMLTDLERLDRNNVDEIAPKIEAEQWGKLDFKQYSKCANPSLKEYEFRLSR